LTVFAGTLSLMASTLGVAPIMPMGVKSLMAS
jgi:hypothetical protein